MTDTSELLGALPTPVQVQLLRLARRAADMSTEEKEAARFLISDVTLQCEAQVTGDNVAAVEMLAITARVVAAVDGLSGDQASWLVV